ncbi:MAG: hypothetical protein ACXABY_21985 [Candidatus Thorarchaeota archaeon]|jgi:hypothetical protein
MRHFIALAALFILISVTCVGDVGFKSDNLFESTTEVTGLGGTTNLTASNDSHYTFNGAGNQTVVLPDAQTLAQGRRFYFFIRGGVDTQALTVEDNDNVTLATIGKGQATSCRVEDISTAAGVWFCVTMASFNDPVNFDLLPNASSAIDLGSSTLRYAETYTEKDITADGTNDNNEQTLGSATFGFSDAPIAGTDYVQDSTSATNVNRAFVRQVNATSDIGDVFFTADIVGGSPGSANFSAWQKTFIPSALGGGPGGTWVVGPMSAGTHDQPPLFLRNQRASAPAVGSGDEGAYVQLQPPANESTHNGEIFIFSPSQYDWQVGGNGFRVDLDKMRNRCAIAKGCPAGHVMDFGSLTPTEELGKFYIQTIQPLVIAVQNLTADNTVITTVRKGHIQLSSDSVTSTDRTFTLEDTTGAIESGQELVITWVGTNTGELVDDSGTAAGIVRLSSTWTPTQYDSLTLVHNGTNWIEKSRSAN